MRNLSSTPPVYIHKAHQNTSGSAVSELMRFMCIDTAYPFTHAVLVIVFIRSRVCSTVLHVVGCLSVLGCPLPSSSWSVATT